MIDRRMTLFKERVRLLPIAYEEFMKCALGNFRPSRMWERLETSDLKALCRLVLLVPNLWVTRE